MSLGRKTLPQYTGRPTRLCAGGYPEYLPIGANIAWELVTAAVSQTELEDGTPVYVGEKAIPVGTVMVPVTTAEVQTVAITGTPAGGSFILKLVRNNISASTPPLAYNASAADVQAALQALPNGSPSITVTKASSTFTATFPAILGNVPQLTSTNTFTGGSTPGITHATTTAGLAYGGKWAPADTSQSDGRQTLTRGKVGLLDYTIKQAELSVMGAYNDTELIGLLTGGLVWGERLKVGGTNQVTLANLLVALPKLEITPAE